MSRAHLVKETKPPRCQFRAAALLLPLAGSPPLVCVLQRFFRLLPLDKFALPARQAARTGGAGGGWRTGVCPPSSPGGSQTAWANKQPWYYHNPPVTEPTGLLIIMVVFSVRCLVFLSFSLVPLTWWISSHFVSQVWFMSYDAFMSFP